MQHLGAVKYWVRLVGGYRETLGVSVQMMMMNDLWGVSFWGVSNRNMDVCLMGLFPMAYYGKMDIQYWLWSVS